MARVAGTDDADRSVAFDDLAEFASALDRSSYFHNPTCFPKLLLVDWLLNLYTKKSKPSITHPYPSVAMDGHAGQTKLEYPSDPSTCAASGGICDTGKDARS